MVPATVAYSGLGPRPLRIPIKPPLALRLTGSSFLWQQKVTEREQQMIGGFREEWLSFLTRTSMLVGVCYPG